MMDPAGRNVTTLTGLRVLIVEDEPLLALCLGEVVEAEGCVVVGTASTVAEATTMVATATFDVALLDLCLHGRPVGAIATAIIERGCGVVFSTGSGASDVPAAFQGWPVLCKPYKDQDLFAALTSAVGVSLPPIEIGDARSERTQ